MSDDSDPQKAEWEEAEFRRFETETNRQWLNEQVALSIASQLNLKDGLSDEWKDAFVTHDNVGLQIAVSPWMNFACGLRINCATGEVVIPEDLELDEAWRQFWEGLARVHPSRPVGFG